MKKSKLMVIFVIVINVFLVNACQKTPEGEFVYQKNNNIYQREESKDGELKQEPRFLADSIDAPESYENKIIVNDELLIDYDAEIFIPNTYEANIYSVQPKEISQSRCDELINELFGNKQIFIRKPFDVITQNDITKEVALIQEMLEYIKVNDLQRYNEEKDEWNKVIEEKLGKLGNYPENYLLTISDGKLKNEKKFVDDSIPDFLNPNIQKIAIQGDLGHAQAATFTIIQSKSLLDTELWFADGSYEYVSGVRLPINGVSKPIDLEISLNDAKNVAKDFINKLGFGDNYIFQEGFYGVLSDPPYTSNPLPIEKRNKYFYDLCYSQSLSNIPLTYTSPYIEISELEREAEKWETEELRIYISDERVFAFIWNFPATIGDKLYESTDLMNFSEIIDIANNTLRYNYTVPNNNDEIIKKELYVDKIELAYAKNISQNAVSQYEIVPCFNFYGKIKTYYKDYVKDSNFDANNAYTDTRPMGTLLTINAINGSIITV